MSICNKDCFNCPHPDCILDELNDEDYVTTDRLDVNFSKTEDQKSKAERNREWRRKNKDKLAAQREANKGKMAAYGRAYREKNKERESARKKAWYLANKASISARRKAEYQAKKQQKEGGDK